MESFVGGRMFYLYGKRATGLRQIYKDDDFRFVTSAEIDFLLISKIINLYPNLFSELMREMTDLFADPFFCSDKENSRSSCH